MKVYYKLTVNFLYTSTLFVLLATALFFSLFTGARAQFGGVGPAPTSYVQVQQQNIAINGVAASSATGLAPSFAIQSQCGDLNTTTGTTSFTYPTQTQIVPNSNGSIPTSFTTYGCGLRTQTTEPQNRNFISSTVRPGESLLAGPNGTVLDSATIVCRGGSVVINQAAVVTGTQTEFRFPAGENDCQITYNFVSAGNLSSFAPQGSNFAILFSISPKVQSLNRGNTVDYTLTSRSAAGYQGAVNYILDPTTPCPANATCTFPNGSSIALAANGTDSSKIFRVTAGAATPLANYNFRIYATPTVIANPSAVYDMGAANIVASVGGTNHAQFVSYEYFTGGTWQPLPSTLNPGQTVQVRINMKNDGLTNWTKNAAGATCSATPPNNGYYLHTADGSTTWGTDKIEALDNPFGNLGAAISSDTSTQMLRIRLASPAREVRQIVGTTTETYGGASQLGELVIVDSAGNIIPRSQIDKAYLYYYSAASGGHSVDDDSDGNIDPGRWDLAPSEIDKLFDGVTATAVSMPLNTAGPYFNPGPNYFQTEYTGDVYLSFVSPVNIKEMYIYQTGQGTSGVSATNPTHYSGNVYVYNPGSVYNTGYNFNLASPFPATDPNYLPKNTWLLARGNTQKVMPFAFTLTAPTTPGTYPFQWRMSQECVQSFDDTTPLQNITIPAGVGPTVNVSAHFPSVASDPTGAKAATVFQNQNYELKWTVSNATSCSSSGTWSGAKSTAGGQQDRSSDSASTGLKTYTVTCSNAVTTVSDTVTVLVVNAPAACNVAASGTNQLTGCVWGWDTVSASADGVAFTNPPNPTSQYWALVGAAPSGPVQTVPVADTSTALDQDWAAGGPLTVTDKFMVVWRGRFNFKNASYAFASGSDDGNAVFLNNSKIRDDWSDHNFQVGTSSLQSLTAGNSDIVYYYYDNLNNARAKFNWENMSGPPGTPTGVQTDNTATNASVVCGEVRVSWIAPSGGMPVSGYNVYRSTNAGGPWVLAPGGGNLSAATLAYTDANPLSLTGANYYAVTALNGAAESAQAVGPSVTPTPCNPSPFNGALGGALLCGQVDFTWADVPNNTGYYIYRNTTGLAPTVADRLPAVIGANATSYSNTGVGTGRFYYWISSYNAGGESPKTAMTPAFLDVTGCGANLSTSEKDIIGHDSKNLNPAGVCNGYQAPPATEIFRSGDRVTFRINICNSSTNTAATDIQIVDSLTNLVQSSAGLLTDPASWNMTYNGGAFTISSVTGTAPNQVLTIDISSSIPAAAAPGSPTVRTLVFTAIVQPPSGFGGTIGRFQNRANINYDLLVGDPGRTGSETPQTSLVNFYNYTANVPDIIEIPSH